MKFTVEECSLGVVRFLVEEVSGDGGMVWELRCKILWPIKISWEKSNFFRQFILKSGFKENLLGLTLVF